MATITTAGIDELKLPNHPETTVWLKRRPNWGDKNKVQVASYLSRKQVGPNEFRSDAPALADFVVTKTLVMIHDWNVTDESGKRVPIVAEALESLDPEDGEFIWNEARKRFDGETDGTAAPLVNSSEPTSATESNPPTPAPSESPA